jgi:Fic family protein
VLAQPLLYLSLYFRRHRDVYYERLQRIRTHGEWESWLEFFLDGVIDVARSATSTTRDIVQLLERDRQKVHVLRRGAATALRVHELASRRVVLRAVPPAHELG